MSHSSGQSSAYAGLAESAALTLILVRHSVTELTKIGAFSGGSTLGPELTETGHRMAAQTAEVIGRIPAIFGIQSPTVVVSSPMIRAVQTAEPIAEKFGVEVIHDEEELREVELGDWEALTSNQIEAGWPGQLRQWRTGTFTPPGGGESYEQVGNRVGAVIEKWRTEYAGQCVVLVGHAAMIRAVIGRALEMPPKMWAKIRVPPCSISIIRYWPDAVELITTGYPTVAPA